MPKIQMNLSDKADEKVKVYMAVNKIETKEEAINTILEKEFKLDVKVGR